MASNDYIEKDLGIVSAYGDALAGGFVGTRAQFQQILARIANGYLPQSLKPITAMAETVVNITGRVANAYAYLPAPDKTDYTPIGVVGFSLLYAASATDKLSPIKIVSVSLDSQEKRVVVRYNYDSTEDIGGVRFIASVLYYSTPVI